MKVKRKKKEKIKKAKRKAFSHRKFTIKLCGRSPILFFSGFKIFIDGVA
jgi:hypothetical protein